MKIALLSAVRNEQKYLPGMIDHLEDYVDGMLFLDDSSTDATPDIIASAPKLALSIRADTGADDHAHEVKHREMLLRNARSLGFDWVLVCDADERFETVFLASMRQIIENILNEGWEPLFSPPSKRPVG